MSFQCLTSQINALSEQVEALILADDEAQCSELLNQRLVLLKKLDLLMKNNESSAELYHDFLLSVQRRDQQAIDMVNISKNKILSDSSHQKKRTNALNTYQKFSG